jgi:hypothetical protein
MTSTSLPELSTQQRNFEDEALLARCAIIPALGKLLSFKLPPTVLKLIPRSAKPCSVCQHKIDGHIFHPSGVRACAERGCFCRIHVWDR